MNISQPEPYILLEMGSGSFQLFIITEQKIFRESTSFIDAVKDLFAVYYVFDIAYPKPLYPVLLFLQRYVLNIKDSQLIPPSVTRLLSSFDNNH